ncbi:hypothetical protein MKEN_00430800 [Mycena kentingensis (nom. inval.)]|nr:hypothetical protein MKEN_00430800 [Mycena kentingensis (nom. inval.)]
MPHVTNIPLNLPSRASPIGGAMNVPPPYSPSYSRVSSFRSPQLEVLLYSPHVTTEPTSWATNRTVPIYSDHDSMSGKVILDQSCRSGCIYLTLTGSFCVKPSTGDAKKASGPAPSSRHVFFYASRTIEVAALDSSPNTPSSFRTVFSRRKSRPSTAEFETRTFPFAFDLGQSHTGKILPSTFSSSGPTSMPVELAYELVATWQPVQLTSKSSILSIPIVIQPDPHLHSLDGSTEKQESWLEIPLKSQRPVPVRCAITLPSTLTFSRASTIPYFVVFTTTPRNATLAREIATDATISISVTSQFFYKEEPPVQSMVDTQMSEQSTDSRQGRLKRKVAQRMRSATSFWSPTSSMDMSIGGIDSMVSSTFTDTSAIRSRSNSKSSRLETSSPLLPTPPPTTFTDTQLVHKSMSIGFPKRPRQSAKNHPTLEAHRSLPDGLFKDKIALHRDMLPSINWGGISLKYFFDVSVTMGTDELRARVLLRVT